MKNKAPLAVCILLYLLLFNIFAAGICNASWHAMSDLKYFHTHGHNIPGHGVPHSGACIENREEAPDHQSLCQAFDICIKAPRRLAQDKEQVCPVPPDPEQAYPQTQILVPFELNHPLAYRGPPAPQPGRIS